MRDEIKRIITMVEEGKISSADATELIEAIEESDSQEATRRASAPYGDPPTNESEPIDSSQNQVGADTSSENARTEPQSNAHDSNQSSRPDHDAKQGDGTAGKDPFRALIDVIEGFGKEASQSVDWQEITQKVRSATKQGLDTVRDVVKEVGEGSFRFMVPGEHREIELPLSIPDGKKLRVENFSGSIHLQGDAEICEVVARADFKSDRNDPDAKSRADNYVLTIEESESEVVIKQPFLENASISLEIRVPKAIDAELKTESSAITVHEVNHLKATCRSGSVSVIHVLGSVDIGNISGSIRVAESFGQFVNLDSKSGSISLEGANGTVSLKTTSGSIEARGITSRAIGLDTVSGSLSLSMIGPSEGTTNLRSVSGNIAIILPDAANCAVSLSSISGKVACDIPLENRADEGKRLTGVVGTGEGKLDCSSVSGSVDVRMPIHQVTG